MTPFPCPYHAHAAVTAPGDTCPSCGGPLPDVERNVPANPGVKGLTPDVPPRLTVDEADALAMRQIEEGGR